MVLENGYEYENYLRSGKGWIRREKDGKHKKIQVTERGHMIANRLFNKEKI